MTNHHANNESQEIEDILPFIESKYQQLKKRLKKDQTVNLYQPGLLSKENRFVMMVRVEIEYVLTLVVAASSGETQPSPISSCFEGSLNQLENRSLIDPVLAADIRDFFSFSTFFIRTHLSSRVYLQIQYISSDILERLYKLLPEPF